MISFVHWLSCNIGFKQVFWQFCFVLNTKEWFFLFLQVSAQLVQKTVFVRFLFELSSFRVQSCCNCNSTSCVECFNALIQSFSAVGANSDCSLRVRDRYLFLEQLCAVNSSWNWFGWLGSLQWLVLFGSRSLSVRTFELSSLVAAIMFDWGFFNCGSIFESQTNDFVVQLFREIGMTFFRNGCVLGIVHWQVMRASLICRRSVAYGQKIFIQVFPIELLYSLVHVLAQIRVESTARNRFLHFSHLMRLQICNQNVCDRLWLVQTSACVLRIAQFLVFFVYLLWLHMNFNQISLFLMLRAFFNRSFALCFGLFWVPTQHFQRKHLFDSFCRLTLSLLDLFVTIIHLLLLLFQSWETKLQIIDVHFLSVLPQKQFLVRWHFLKFFLFHFTVRLFFRLI